MESDFPQTGHVFEYHFLWKWQAERGETEGRKKRPCCVAIITVNNKNQTIIFIAPITSKKPVGDRAGLQIPEIEARRSNISTDISLWVITDELNADVLETSYTLEDRTGHGSFSKAFTDKIVRSIQETRQLSQLKITNRQ